MKWNYNFGGGCEKNLPLAERKSVSLLLGAGFSVPKGYPTGKKVNESLLNFDDFPISFTPSGEMVISNERESIQTDWPVNDYQKLFRFCKRLILLYAEKNNGFDYEVFYDFIKSKEIYGPIYKELANDFISSDSDYNRFVSGIDTIYNQMVSYIICDAEGKTWYDEEPSQIGYVEGYDSFLNLLKNWCNDNIINVHTLNHDLLFESFRKTEYLSGLVSDGFDEYGSCYYGIVRKGNASYHVRLERYKGRYPKPIRLYKLHGSLDYVLYKRTVDNCVLIPDNYVKTRKFVSPGNLLRSRGSKMGYELYPFAVHADFLTGTTSKISRYGEPTLYKKLFKKFKSNLRNADKLIIIGYGGKDLKINKIILENFNFSEKKSYVFDPFPSDELKEFAKMIHSTLITKSVSDMSINDIK